MRRLLSRTDQRTNDGHIRHPGDERIMRQTWIVVRTSPPGGHGGYAMRAWMATGGMLLFAAGVLTGGGWQTPVGAQGFSVVMECGAASAPLVRTTLYFGLARPQGSVSELEW